MRANDSFQIAVLAGDGIGPEVMAPALAVLKKLEAATPNLRFRFTEAPAGADHYRATGTALPELTVKLCDEADAILLGACGLPHIRYPDGTEIAPQVELRFIFDPLCRRAAGAARSRNAEPDRRRGRARDRSRRHPRIDRRALHFDGQGRGDRG
jgi:isocitrate dehydrogenase